MEPEMKYNNQTEVSKAYARISDLLNLWWMTACLVGSCAVNGKGNDLDVLVHPDNLPQLLELTDLLTKKGFQRSLPHDLMEYPESEDFVSYRLVTDQDNFNVILVSTRAEYQKWSLAASLSTHFKVQDRDLRIALYDLVFIGLS